MKAFTCIAVLIIVATSGVAQSIRANNWAFPRGNGLDFSNGTPTGFGTALPAFGSLTQGTSSISDLNGNLLIYSNGEKVWNGAHQVITGGNSLNGSQESTQSSIIVPAPNTPDRYQLFTLDDNGGGNGLTYYSIDMAYNSGAGIVFPGVQLDTILTEKLAAVKHGNDFDYWVVAHKWQSDTFFAYHVDSFGVNSVPVISKVGLPHVGQVNTAMGQMKISPDGSKIALASFAGGHVQLLTFNDETGEVSAPLTLQNYLANFPFGVEFSPDSRKLYYVQRFSANPEAILFQYDLDHLDTTCLLASEFELAQVNELKVPSNLQLGIDGRIYMTVNYFSSYDTLAVINYPNLYGYDAFFEEFGFNTDSSLVEGLTNFPSSFLSDGIRVVFGSTCDGAPTYFFPEDSLGLDSVRWNFGDAGSGNNSSFDVYASHIFSEPDTFLVTLYTFNGNNADTFYRNVVIWDTAVNLLGNDTTICDNSSPVVLDASWYNACVEWSTGSTNSTISVSTGGIYWVDVYYQSCYFRDSIYIEGVSGPPEFTLGNDTAVCSNFTFVLDPDLSNAYYTWQDNSHDTTLLITSTGTYSLTATNACGSNTDTLNVTVNQAAQPTLAFPTDTIVCDTASFILDVTFEDAVYLWSDGSTSAIKTITEAGTYWVRIGNICDTVSDTMNVSFDGVATSNLIYREVLCNAPDSLILLATKDSLNVAWNTGAIAPTINASAEGKYWFTFENVCGLISDSIHVLKWDTSFQIDLGQDTVLCADTTVRTIGLLTDDFPFSFLWSNGSKTPTINVSSGSYAVTATNRCAVLSDDIVFSLPEPIFILEPTSHEICDGETIAVGLNSDSIQSAHWSDGQIGATSQFTAPGLYSVSIVDLFGCSHMDSLTLGDECPPLIFAGNVFTPGNDNVNDSYCIITENITQFELRIFNRWGQMVFVAFDPSTCWDGQIQGHPADEGTYFYLINALDNSGNAINFRGSLTLLR